SRRRQTRSKRDWSSDVCSSDLFGFDRALYTFGPEGFAPYRDAYTAACVNLGRRVAFTQPGGAGEGTAAGIDGEGRLIVRTDAGEDRKSVEEGEKETRSAARRRV